MNPRKEATYRMLSLIAAVIFVLPCVFLVFPTFDINPDDLWQMDSLMEFICAYKITAAAASIHAPPISGSDEYWMVGFS